MAIYALSDLHLSLSNPEKSMDVFGSAWDGYIERIERGIFWPATDAQAYRWDFAHLIFGSPAESVASDWIADQERLLLQELV